MSDHDPNGDDDLTNPMSKIGYGRGDESVPQRHRTLAYSIVDGKEVPMGGRMAREMPAVKPTPIVNINSALAPTEEMEAVPLAQPMTVRRVIAAIIEVDMIAWKALPITVQELLLSSPTSFRFHEFQKMSGLNLVPDIIYNGVRFRYECDGEGNTAKGVWKLYSIGEK